MDLERSNLKLKYQKVRKNFSGQQEAVTTIMIDLLPVVFKKLQIAGLFWRLLQPTTLKGIGLQRISLILEESGWRD